MELAAKVPNAPMTGITAVDVAASKEAAGLPEDADPLSVGGAAEDLRFAFSTFYALRDVSQLSDNPVRSALDHSLITAYAGHQFILDGSVTLVSTTQPFDDIADSLKDAGWSQDGDLVSTDGDPEQLTYTAVGAGDGFLVLGYNADLVNSVASGEAKPSDAGELDLLHDLDAPVVFAQIPDTKGLECVQSLTFTDTVDGNATFYINVDGIADKDKVARSLQSDLASIGWKVPGIEADGHTVTLTLQGLEDEGLATSPAAIAQGLQDDQGPLIYDCG